MYFDDFIVEANDFVEIEYTKELKKIKTPDNLYSYKYKGLYIGDLIYDEVLRNGSWNATISAITQRINKPLKTAISIIMAMDQLSNHYDIKCTTFSHNIGVGGLIQRYYAHKSIENITGIVGSGPIHKFNEFDGVRNPFPGKIPKQTILRIANNIETRNRITNLADNYLTKRLNGTLSNLDAKKAFANDASMYDNIEDFCEKYALDPTKKCVFVMLHAFNDYPNIFKTIYKDYFLWFKHTLQIAQNQNNVNWIFKEHPTSQFYPTQDVVL